MNEKPREKLIKYGPEKLETSELLAIILGSGNRNENVFDMSKRLIKKYENNIFEKIRSVEHVQNLWKTGKVQACRIIAASELGKRLFQKNPRKIIIKNAKEAAHHLKNMGREEKEHCKVLYLSTQNTLVAEEVISIGSIDASIIHPREVFSGAIKENAASIIIAHNHPSGDPIPSQKDMRLTEILKKAGEIIGITVLDHIIIGENHYFSFENGTITKFRSSLAQS